ncbi:MAG: ribonuclease HII [Candidatus Nucleicultricaceae bacterium]
MNAPTFDLENRQAQPVAGCDEAGCGPWAGPVVAGAVILLQNTISPILLSLLNDSKKLTAKKRESAFDALMGAHGTGCWVGVGQASVKEIDQLNIRRAAQLAMKRAVESLSLKPSYVLVDGTGNPAWSFASEPIIKGDQKSYSIAAASIIAKVTRDRLMTELGLQFPAYGWQNNAGYGTKTHQEALAQFGITPHHRTSFAPIKALLLKAS